MRKASLALLATAVGAVYLNVVAVTPLWDLSLGQPGERHRVTIDSRWSSDLATQLQHRTRRSTDVMPLVLDGDGTVLCTDTLSNQSTVYLIGRGLRMSSLMPELFHDKRVPSPVCTRQTRPATCLSSGLRWQGAAKSLDTASLDLYSCGSQCPVSSECFLGTCVCHPSYQGEGCQVRMKQANPWYTADCPNIKHKTTLDIAVTDIGGQVGCEAGLEYNVSFGTGVSSCAYLCYSHPEYGVPIVPTKIWTAAQAAEGLLWSGGLRFGWGDRIREHLQGFDFYRCLPTDLGDVVEFGAGPWTQSNAMVAHNTKLRVKSFTVIEPGADDYIKNIPTCVYRSRNTMEKYHRDGTHPFPVYIVSDLGEGTTYDARFDTVVSINVIEHVQNAFEYLHSLHRSLKAGGILIFHECWCNNPFECDGRLGKEIYHPIRLRRSVFDWFLAKFDVIFNNCNGMQTIDGWKQRMQQTGIADEGYYFIGRKKSST